MSATDDPTPAVEPTPGGAEGTADERMYVPTGKETQLTVRAIVAGCLIGSLVSGINLMLGLRIGWTLGGSIIAAILGFALFRALAASGLLKTQYSLLEANITQTAGSAAGSMTSAAGLVAAIPALSMMEGAPELGWIELTIWAGAVAYLGVFFAVPLRRQMVVIEKLRFPTGTATAETLSTMFASGEEAMSKARSLLLWMVAAFGIAFVGYFIPELLDPLHLFDRFSPETLGSVGLLVVAIPVSLMVAWTFSFSINLVLGAAGILIGPRVGVSLLIGAILSWGIIAPIAVSQGWAAGPWAGEDGLWTSGWLMKFDAMPETMVAAKGAPAEFVGLSGARAWLLWPGVAIMVAEALSAVAVNWRSVLGTFTMFRKGGDGTTVDTAPDQIPTLWWVGGLGISTVLATIAAWFFFDIPWYLTLAAIALSAVLATIAVRSTGETDINPVGGMGKITQIAFAGLAPGAAVTNLMSAAITGAGASQAADMMQDLKTGHLLGASPRRQFIAQLIGIGAGVIVCVPAYMLVTSAYEIGGEGANGLPAPAAMAWKGMADLLSTGFSGLPPGALYAVLAGLGLGIALPTIRALLPKDSKIRTFIPSGLAIGIAFIVDAKYSVIMFVGAMVLVLWQRLAPDHCKRLAFPVASGIIAGGALFDLILGAPLMLGGVPDVWGMAAWFAAE